MPRTDGQKRALVRARAESYACSTTVAIRIGEQRIRFERGELVRFDGTLLDVPFKFQLQKEVRA